MYFLLIHTPWKIKLYPNIVPLISPLAAPINMKYQKWYDNLTLLLLAWVSKIYSAHNYLKKSSFI